jgi:hypothetical protein
MLLNWIRKRRHIRAYTGDLAAMNKELQRHLAELKNKKAEVQEDIFDVTMYILEENIDLYKSIITLYKQGHFRSCLILVRNILENFVNLQYIYADDSEKRAKNFRLFSALHYLKRVDKVKDVPPEIKKEFSEMRQSMELDYQPSGNKKGHWDGKSMRKMCDELKLTIIYEDWYSRLSSYTHSQYRGNRDLDHAGPYNNFLRDLVVKHVSVVGLQTLYKINSKYNLTEDIVILHDYPQEGAVFLFAVNERTKG